MVIHNATSGFGCCTRCAYCLWGWHTLWGMIKNTCNLGLLLQKGLVSSALIMYDLQCGKKNVCNTIHSNTYILWVRAVGQEQEREGLVSAVFLGNFHWCRQQQPTAAFHLMALFHYAWHLVTLLPPLPCPLLLTSLLSTSNNCRI